MVLISKYTNIKYIKNNNKICISYIFVNLIKHEHSSSISSFANTTLIPFPVFVFIIFVVDCSGTILRYSLLIAKK